MDYVRRAIAWLIMIIHVVGSVGLIGLMLVIGGTVIYRWFGGTFQGSYEVAETFTIVTITLAIFMATVEQTHVTVSIFYDRLGSGAQRFFDSVLGLLAFGFWCFAFWSVLQLTLSVSKHGEFTPVLGINIVPFRWVIVVGFGAVALVLLIRAIRAMLGIRDKDTKDHDYGYSEGDNG